MIIQILQFVLGLSILIVLHELGHFIPAKLFKTRVEKFYLFFDPYFSLVKKKIGETTYGIGWLPLGGYVKIAGMVDESMDKEQMAEEPKPWEFRSKPAWQRLIILSGGVIVNFVLAIVIYSGMMAYYGEQVLSMDNLKYGIHVEEVGESMGLKSGDKIISINGKKVERFNNATMEILLGEGGDVVVERNGQELALPITTEFLNKAIADKSMILAPRLPYIAGYFSDSSRAKAAGLEEGDSLVALNGEPLLYYDQYLDEVPKFKNQEITVTAYRNGERKDITMKLGEDGKMGVGPNPDLNRYFTLDTYTYSGIDAIAAGWKTAIGKLDSYIRQFKLIFNSETGAYKEVGGFLTILKQYPSTWNWEHFWGFTAFLSIMLGFLNILPIPALDGGHVLFVLAEMITGRKPSTKFLENAQMVGFFLLLGLLIFANGNDILRLFK